MVELRGLSKRYRIGDQVIDAVVDVNLSIGGGEFVTILGHSGSGKSTLLSMIGGLARPTAGTVVIGGEDIWRRDDRFRALFRNRRIGFVFQFASLIPTLNAVENVALPRRFGEAAAMARAEQDAILLLDRVGLSDRLYCYPSELSGGQQRRVAIARALINRPGLILADEPTGDLDEETEAQVMSLLRESALEFEAAFLLVTHSRDLTRDATQVVRLRGGALQ